MNTQNLPIAYDFHGDIPFTVPFHRIKPSDIHIYLDLDTKIGKNTCGQACSHCWFVNYEKVHNKQFNLAEGRAIKEGLEGLGYKVFARYVDSFAYSGDFMRIHGPAHNREFRQEADHTPTKTMQKGDAWTSGAPLLADNYTELLDLARDSGYGTISITYHGLLDEDLQVLPESNYPIKGVFYGKKLEEVAGRIQAYNQKQKKEDRFRLNIGVTIGRHNHSRESLIRYAHYFNGLGVATVRFNNFTDHGGRHPELPLDRAGIEEVYRDIKWLHSNVELNFQLAVSEDFGTFGIEVMEFPKHVGQCQAGRQLFTVIPAQEKVIYQNSIEKLEKIGDIVACVNIFEPNFGFMLRRTNITTGSVNYSLEFDYDAIESFTLLRVNGHYQNGCFAKELKEEKEIALSAVAKSSIKQRGISSEISSPLQA